MFRKARNFIRFRRLMHQAKIIGSSIRSIVLRAVNWLIPLLCLLAGAITIYDLGFNSFDENDLQLATVLRTLLLFVFLCMLARFIGECFLPKKWKTRLFQVLLLFLLWYLYSSISMYNITLMPERSNRFIFNKVLLYSSVIFFMVTESSHLISFAYRKNFNPALLFVLSFILLILIGTGLLMLPKATNGGIELTDALFTASSAVCVTGLTVVDTATHFSTFGHIILLLLIQIGGLGVMTFAGLLGYALSGDFSFQGQLALKDMISNDKLSTVLKTVTRILLVTLLFEASGAFLIYLSLDDGLFTRQLDKIFFAVFHSVSAFCNAGFSTYSAGLYEIPIRFNYNLHLVVAFLIILGGMGFPIVFNVYRYFVTKLSNIILYLRGISRKDHIPRLMNINTRLALVMSAILLVLGTVSFYFFEKGGSLQEHTSSWGKFVSSFMGSVSPRTAGVNTVDLSTLRLPTIMIYLLLMWIGASPGSTGGGIKTTTAAVAILNMMSTIRGKNRTEYFKTEISQASISRAFAIMMISLLVIGTAIFLLSIYDGHNGLIKLSFEVFSAFSTVGLTMGLTPHLTDFSKLVLVVTMFIGRVGALTLFIALVKQKKDLFYRYPSEEITF